MFLLSDGSLTLMNMAFFMVLGVVHLPTNYGEVVHTDVMTHGWHGHRWGKGP